MGNLRIVYLITVMTTALTAFCTLRHEIYADLTVLFTYSLLHNITHIIVHADDTSLNNNG